MPVAPTYPGVYIQEISSGVRTITGVPTSITAFVGAALRGPVDEAYRITSWSDFDRTFGGLWRDSLLGYGVYHYYQNGGADAVIVRVAQGAEAASIDLSQGIILEVMEPGAWGSNLRVRVAHPADTADVTHYDLYIRDMGSGYEERFLNVSTGKTDPRSLDRVLSQSRLVTTTSAESLEKRPDANGEVGPGENWFDDPKPKKAPVVDASTAVPATTPSTPGSASAPGSATTPTTTPSGTAATPASSASNAKLPYTKVLTAGEGSDGGPITAANILGDDDIDKPTGIYALRKTDIFNLLVIPPTIAADKTVTDIDPGTLAAAAKLCSEERAMLIADAPSNWRGAQDITAANGKKLSDFTNPFGIDGRNAALFFPHVWLADPLQKNQLAKFPPSGAIAGVFARTDVQRGVWKAPAGTDATLNGVQKVGVVLTDRENGILNPLAVNCVRIFPVYGPLVWGSRTMRGADQLADDDYRYIPVRRLTLYIEESLYRALHWVVFEPNDEPLWSQIRLNVGAFMQNLFRQGAFQGKAPREAYFVKCDKETTTQNDINRGIVNVLVGFAPLKPAEFVIVTIQQMAGQIQV